MEEYDEVRVIAAPSLKQALRDAYQLTLHEYGPSIVLYQEIGEAQFENLGDPFGELFPESVPPGWRGGVTQRVVNSRTHAAPTGTGTMDATPVRGQTEAQSELTEG